MSLFDAVMVNDLEALRTLLAAGAFPDELGPGGSTPLHQAGRRLRSQRTAPAASPARGFRRPRAV